MSTHSWQRWFDSSFLRQRLAFSGARTWKIPCYSWLPSASSTQLFDQRRASFLSISWGTLHKLRATRSHSVFECSHHFPSVTIDRTCSRRHKCFAGLPVRWPTIIRRTISSIDWSNNTMWSLFLHIEQSKHELYNSSAYLSIVCFQRIKRKVIAWWVYTRHITSIWWEFIEIT